MSVSDIHRHPHHRSVTVFIPRGLPIYRKELSGWNVLWQKHLSPSLDYGKWIAGIIRGRTFQLFYRQLIVQFQPRYLLSTYKPVHLLHRISYVSQMPCYEVWRLGVSDHRLVARFPTPSEHRPLVSTTTTLTPFGALIHPSVVNYPIIPSLLVLFRTYPAVSCTKYVVLKP